MNLQHKEEPAEQHKPTLASSTTPLEATVEPVTAEMEGFEARLAKLDRLEKIANVLNKMYAVPVITGLVVVLGGAWFSTFNVEKLGEFNKVSSYLLAVDFASLLLIYITPFPMVRRSQLIEAWISTGDKRCLHHALNLGYIKWIFPVPNRMLLIRASMQRLTPLFYQVGHEDTTLFTPKDIRILNNTLKSGFNALPSSQECLPYCSIASALSYVGNSDSLRILNHLQSDWRISASYPEFHATLQTSIERLKARLDSDSSKETLLRASSPAQPNKELLRPLKEPVQEENALLLRPTNNTEPTETNHTNTRQ